MQSESLYRNIIKQALRITRNHPILWIFGFFAALLGNGGEVEFILVQFKSFSSGMMDFSDSFLALFGTGGKNAASFFIKFFQASDSWLAILVGLILFLGVLWLTISSQGALACGIAEAGALGKVNLKENFLYASKRFFSLLCILFISRFSAIFIFLVIGIPFAALLMYFLNPLVSTVVSLFVVGLPLMVFASMVSKYAVCYRLFENKKTSDSLSSAINLFSEHWLVSIELALFLFVLNLVFGFFMIFMFVFFSAPFVLATRLLEETHYLLALASLIIGEIVLFATLMVFGSILAVFQNSAWVEMFVKIRNRKYFSKLIRVLMSLKEKYS